MPEILPLYEVRLLAYPVEVFARTAVSNAIWLTGEWLAQRPKRDEPFTPDLRFLFDVRCCQEALQTIDGLPEDLSYQIFVAGFMWRTTDGGSAPYSTVRDPPSGNAARGPSKRMVTEVQYASPPGRPQNRSDHGRQRPASQAYAHPLKSACVSWSCNGVERWRGNIS